MELESKGAGTLLGMRVFTFCQEFFCYQITANLKFGFQIRALLMEAWDTWNPSQGGGCLVSSASPSPSDAPAEVNPAGLLTTVAVISLITWPGSSR